MSISTFIFGFFTCFNNIYWIENFYLFEIPLLAISLVLCYAIILNISFNSICVDCMKMKEQENSAQFWLTFSLYIEQSRNKKKLWEGIVLRISKFLLTLMAPLLFDSNNKFFVEKNAQHHHFYQNHYNFNEQANLHHL